MRPARAAEVDPRLSDFQADERKFKQILVNLLSNAVEFTLDGGRVDVRDTGIGSAPGKGSTFSFTLPVR